MLVLQLTFLKISLVMLTSLFLLFFQESIERRLSSLEGGLPGLEGGLSRFSISEVQQEAPSLRGEDRQDTLTQVAGQQGGGGKG